MKSEVPPNQSRQEAEHPTSFLKSKRRDSVPVRLSKVAGRHSQEAEFYEQEDTYVDPIRGKRPER